MSRFISKIAKYMPKKVAMTFAMIAAVLVPAAIWAAQGPDRPTYTMERPAAHITFNSITNNKGYTNGNGDERNFLTCWGSDKKPVDVVKVDNDTTYTCAAYVHNNASANMNLVAENVRALVSVPSGLSTSKTIQTTINSTNAQPKAVYDDVKFQNANNFTLNYVAGSAYYQNNKGKFTIADSLVNGSGALLGYESMNGKIPGCLNYSGYLYFNVKAKVETPKVPSYDLAKSVSPTGSVKPGDTLTYTLKFTNTGNVDLTNVVIKDKLPAEVEWTNVKISATNASGLPSGSGWGANLFAEGITIGKVNVKGVVTITITTKVKSNAVVAEECGENSKKIINTAESKTDQKPDQPDNKDEDNPNNNSAENTVTVDKDCKYSYDLIKEVDKTSAKPGEIVNYTLTFKNTGNQTLTNVIVKDTLPKGVTYVKGSTTVNGDKKADGVTTDAGLNIGTVKAGESVVIKFQAKLPAKEDLICGETKFVNTSSVTVEEKPDQPDNKDEDNPNNNSAETVVDRECNPDFDIVKTVDKKTAKPGETLKYTLTFTNKGEIDLTNVIIRDVLPSNVTLNSEVKVDPNTGVSGDLFSEDGMKIEKVEVGKKVVITFSVKIDDEEDLLCGETTLINVVGSGASELPKEPDTTNNSAETVVDRECEDNPNPPVVPPVVPPTIPPVYPPAPQPVQPIYPSEIASTGTNEFVAAVAGVGVITFAGVAYARSRWALKFLNR